MWIWLNIHIYDSQSLRKCLPDLYLADRFSLWAWYEDITLNFSINSIITLFNIHMKPLRMVIYWAKVKFHQGEATGEGHLLSQGEICGRSLLWIKQETHWIFQTHPKKTLAKWSRCSWSGHPMKFKNPAIRTSEIQKDIHSASASQLDLAFLKPGSLSTVIHTFIT